MPIYECLTVDETIKDVLDGFGINDDNAMVDAFDDGTLGM